MAIDQGVGDIVRNADYYFRDGSVTFLVERQLFRVHRYFFERESAFFERFFARSEDNDGTDKKPYVLEVKSDDFAKFLWVWYNPRYTYSNQPKETWLTIMTLAAQWGFESMRNLAISQLECISLDPVDKIALYKEHKVDGRLLIPSYIELCRSPTLPSPAEGERLKMETVLRLAAARERALMRAVERGCITPTSADVEDDELESIISDVFELDPVGPYVAIFPGESPSPSEDWVKINGSDNKKTSRQAGPSCPVLKNPCAPSAAAGGAAGKENDVAPKDKGKGKSK
ncbi:hypothetical protein ID866_9596 [Astraeus odoratus]|nr:hypothetical protein ID866_9596 [Astraeus odoratus]